MLKSLGAATAFSTVGVSVSRAQSRPSLDKRIEQSHRVLQAAGPEKQHKFLRKHGVATAMDSGSMSVPSGASDGPSTQTLDTHEITLTFSLYTDCETYDSGVTAGDGTYIAEMTWEYDETVDDYGDAPKDYVGIGWDNNTWYYEDNNTSDVDSYSNNVSYYGDEGRGPAWEVADGAILDGADGDTVYWANVDLVWNGTDNQKDNRTIAASYTHTWDEVGIDSVSVSYPAGVSLTVSNEDKKWYKNYNDNGDFLKLRFNDLHGC